MKASQLDPMRMNAPGWDKLSLCLAASAKRQVAPTNLPERTCPLVLWAHDRTSDLTSLRTPPHKKLAVNRDLIMPEEQASSEVFLRTLEA